MSCFRFYNWPQQSRKRLERRHTAINENDMALALWCLILKISDLQYSLLLLFCASKAGYQIYKKIISKLATAFRVSLEVIKLHWGLLNCMPSCPEGRLMSETVDTRTMNRLPVGHTFKCDAKHRYIVSGSIKLVWYLEELVLSGLKLYWQIYWKDLVRLRLIKVLSVLLYN